MARVALPTTVDEAVDLLALPGAHAIAGGTDLMPDVNAARVVPQTFVVLAGIGALHTVAVDAESAVVGAGVTYSRLMSDAEGLAQIPVLAAMARTVGTPASRNAGTLGGAIGTARGSADVLTALSALDTELCVAGRRGERTVALADWLSGGRAPGDLVVRVRIRRPGGPCHYAKVMHRQAAAPAVVNCAVAVSPSSSRVHIALGGVGTVPVRPSAAEDCASAGLAAGDIASPALARRVGDLVAAEITPAPTFRASAGYRRHAAAVLAGRLLRRCASESAAV